MHSGEEDKSEDVLAEKMIRILTVYPKLSPSMLHIGLGPAVPAKLWKPILEGLITSQRIKREVVPAPGGRTCVVLSLNDLPVQTATT